MTIFSKAAGVLAVIAAASALYASSSVTAAGPARESVQLRERAGALLDVGSKRAVAYYVKDANACQVSVIVSETYPEQIPYNIASVRFSASVPGGTSTELATSDGSVLSLTCATGAKSLAVESREAIAWAATN